MSHPGNVTDPLRCTVIGRCRQQRPRSATVGPPQRCRPPRTHNNPETPSSGSIVKSQRRPADTQTCKTVPLPIECSPYIGLSLLSLGSCTWPLAAMVEFTCWVNVHTCVLTLAFLRGPPSPPLAVHFELVRLAPQWLVRPDREVGRSGEALQKQTQANND